MLVPSKQAFTKAAQLVTIQTHGVDKAWEQALKERIEEANQAYAQAFADFEQENREWEKMGNEEREAIGAPREPDEVDEDLIADQLGENWESSFNDYLYEREGYSLTGCLQSDLMVMKSKFFTYAQFCSPCVPGAGNLNTPFLPADSQQSAAEIETMAIAMGFPKVYCLNHDWFESGKAPYPVFAVADGKQVFCESDLETRALDRETQNQLDAQDRSASQQNERGYGGTSD